MNVRADGTSRSLAISRPITTQTSRLGTSSPQGTTIPKSWGASPSPNYDPGNYDEGGVGAELIEGAKYFGSRFVNFLKFLVDPDVSTLP